MTKIPHKLMCFGKLKVTHWALWPHGGRHYPLNLPNKVWVWALAAMDSCFGLIRPDQRVSGSVENWIKGLVHRWIN